MKQKKQLENWLKGSECAVFEEGFLIDFPEQHEDFENFVRRLLEFSCVIVIENETVRKRNLVPRKV